MDDSARTGFTVNRLGLGLVALGFVLAVWFAQTTDICTTRYAPELLLGAAGSFLAGFALCLPRLGRRIVLIALAVLAVPAIGVAIFLTGTANGWC